MTKIKLNKQNEYVRQQQKKKKNRTPLILK